MRGHNGALAQDLRELETEYESEYEGEYEGDLEGEFESEYEDELEGEYEGTFESEYEEEYEGEYEGDQFFGGLNRIGRSLRRLTKSPLFKTITSLAPQIVATAAGGPVGGALVRGTTAALGQGEYEEEEEYEGEFEEEYEGEFEEEYEAGTASMSQQEVMAEFLAAVAAQAQTDTEAEAMMGAATAASVSDADPATLQSMLPALLRAVAVLTRLLRRQRRTRHCVRAVPTIVRNTARVLSRRAASGQPVTRRAAARTMANQTRRVLGNPRAYATAVQRNVRATQQVARNSMRPRQPAARPRQFYSPRTRRPTMG